MPNVSNYSEQGGDSWVAGGTLDVTGTLKIGGTTVTSTAAELNLIDGAERLVKVAKVALSAVDTAGGLAAWQNPESSAVIVERVIVDVTTAATGACTADVGISADATTLDDTLIDGADVGSAAGVFDNVDDQGTNGESKQRLDANGGSTDYVTASVASGASAGIVGNLYIHYVVV